MTATYTFLPWVQGGIARSIAATDDPTTALTARVTLPVSVHVDGAGDVPATVKLYGPGDVTGLDPAQIVRRDPAPGTTRFESGYMPQVQFARGDLPWLFTPAAPGTTRTRLRPWLVLVTVRKDRARLVGNVLEVDDPAAELPDLSQSWAWAHGQITALPAGGRTTDVLANDPGRACSRLVCPRRLEPDTAYRACLVPAFAAGVQAGLGQPVDETQLAPAWSGSAPVKLPVYDTWEFSTGPAGSFETLVRRLHPSPVTAAPAQLDLSDPGAGLPAAPGVAFQSVLRTPSPPTPDTPPPGPGAAFTSALQQALTGPGLAPPIYGALQAGVNGVPNTGWLRDLNLDPRLRIAAAAGTTVVQERQEELMARAWEQAGAAREANAMLRGAQLARELGSVIMDKHLKPLGGAAFVAITQPAHAQIDVADGTVESELRRSRVPEAAVSGAMRRFASPLGLIARRARAAQPVDMLAATDLVARTPPLAPPNGMVMFNLVAGHADPDTRDAFTPDAVKVTLVDKLAPETTVVARTQDALAAPDSLWTRPDPLAPAETGPHFGEPMYDGLARVAPALFMPSIADVDQDGVALLETTPAVIEAYMAGLNHELSRELLWREFPAQLTGTAFRQFWQAPDPDVPPLAQWGTTALGSHLRGSGSQVVLLVRSELLRRFPTTTIYAAKAGANGTLDATTRLAPSFRAALPPDVVCVGFALSEQDAANYYFVFEQYPGEPRFGFDDVATPGVPKTSDALAWAHVALSPSGHADVSQPLNAAANLQALWGKNAANTASLTFQQPFRVALHASRLIPRSAT